MKTEEPADAHTVCSCMHILQLFNCAYHVHVCTNLGLTGARNHANTVSGMDAYNSNLHRFLAKQSCTSNSIDTPKACNHSPYWVI